MNNQRKKYCIDCGKKIKWKSKRCRKCYLKIAVGKHAPNFKDGKCLKKHFCIDCGKELGGFDSKRCNSCNTKYQFKIGTRNYNGLKNPTHRRKTPNNYWLGKKFTKQHREKIGKKEQGKKHWNWKGGLSKHGYYNFNNPLKKFIRKRDNHTCQLCGIKQKKYYRKLDVHHIDYDKKNCKEDNLITLCQRCNIKVNQNRNYWCTYFTYIIKKKGEIMNREIKFRGKRVVDGKWVYGGFTFDAANNPRITTVDKSGEGLIFHKVIPESVGQFIGSQDKRKVDIYEGDITKDANKDLRIVIWYFSGFYFKYIKPKGGSDTKIDISKLKIVGNKTDNPKLLEV